MTALTHPILGQTDDLIAELEAFLASIPEPSPDAGAIEEGAGGDLPPLPGSQHETTVRGRTVQVPGGGNVNLPNDFWNSGETPPPFIGPPPITGSGGDSGGGSGGAW